MPLRRQLRHLPALKASIRDATLQAAQPPLSQAKINGYGNTTTPSDYV